MARPYAVAPGMLRAAALEVLALLAAQNQAREQKEPHSDWGLEQFFTRWERLLQDAAMSTARQALVNGIWYERRNKTVDLYQLSRELRRALHRLTCADYEVYCADAKNLGLPCELFPEIRLGLASLALPKSFSLGWSTAICGLGPNGSGLFSQPLQIFNTVFKNSVLSRISSPEVLERLRVLNSFAEQALGPAGGKQPVDEVARAYDEAAREFAKSRRG